MRAVVFGGLTGNNNMILRRQFDIGIIYEIVNSISEDLFTHARNKRA
jgi:hypothetical protein